MRENWVLLSINCKSIHTRCIYHSVGTVVSHYGLGFLWVVGIYFLKGHREGKPVNLVMISSLSQCLCSLLATPIKGNVRKTSISEKVEKTRLSQAYIETIKVTVASLPSVDSFTMQAQAGHLTLPNCLLLLTRYQSLHSMFLAIQGLSFVVLIYSPACVIIVSCIIDCVML